MDVMILAGIAAAVVIAVTSRVGPRWHVAAPLLLLVIGIGASFLPFIPDIEVEPELILAVVLPPLLFSSAVNMPAMNFRREFSAIGGLAVVLVITSSVLLGLFFHLIFPSLDLAWCIALGAILSPTDAVATSIAKGVGISSRVTTILEGESLLNDATALVTLRTAIAAAASAFSVWHAVGQFAYSVIIAIVIGLVVGKLGVWARKITGDATVSTILSLVVPFAAAVPTDLLGASGLVAAVVAGIVTGRKKDRVFRADQRVSDRAMWQTVTLVLESGVFLLMGLELRGLLHEQQAENTDMGPLWLLLLIAFAALVLMMIIRAAYVLPLIRGMGRKASRAQSMQPRLEAMESAIADRDMRRARDISAKDPAHVKHRVKKSVVRAMRAGRGAEPSVEAVESRWRQLERRTRRVINDVDYYTKQPLTGRDGAVMVAAGMRGAVTLAAAQTLPLDAPGRASLVLIAFAVAVFSLLVQGGLLAPFVKWVKPSVPDPEDLRRQRQCLWDALSTVPVEPREGESMTQTKLRVVVARREVLLDLVEDGYYDPECTTPIMASLDATELGLQLRQDEVEDLVLEDGGGLGVETLADDLDDAGEAERDRREMLAQAELVVRTTEADALEAEAEASEASVEIAAVSARKQVAEQE